ncbi:MAG: MBL fold metallo-hydrolase RNA specificity domain-containing protein [Nitrososphaeraceae archaeon]
MTYSLRLSNIGLFLENKSTKIHLDPTRLSKEIDLVFISHAHSDHVYKKSKNLKTNIKTLLSYETKQIAHARGYTIENAIYEKNGFQLIDSGHILGSRALVIEDNICYTGDISTRKRGFIKGSKHIPKVETLIIESTFGKPEYIFPDIKEIIHRTNEIISHAYNHGKPVVLMGYALGKAQLLTDYFGHWDPFIVHDSIYEMNNIYKESGINLREAVSYSDAEKENILSTKKPWLLLSPLMNGKSKFISNLKKKYDVITIGFSGWSCKNGYKNMMNLDYALPMSDHCDFNELIEIVKKTKPTNVITFHGFSQEFARSLRKIGFHAESIETYKREIVQKQRRFLNIDTKRSLDNYL